MQAVLRARASERVRGLVTPVVDEATKFRTEHEAWLASIDADWRERVAAMELRLAGVPREGRTEVPDGLASAAWWKDRSRHGRGEVYVRPSRSEMVGEFVVMVGSDGTDMAAYTVAELTEGKTEMEVARLFCTREAPCKDREHRDYNHHRCDHAASLADWRAILKPYRVGIRKLASSYNNCTEYHGFWDLKTGKRIEGYSFEPDDSICCYAFMVTGRGWTDEPKK